MSNSIRESLLNILEKGETIINENGTATTKISKDDMLDCLLRDPILSEEEIDKEMQKVIQNYEKLFVKYYFKKEYSELTKEDKHEMDCFGAFGIAEWCRDNIKDME